MQVLTSTLELLCKMRFVLFLFSAHAVYSAWKYPTQAILICDFIPLSVLHASHRQSSPAHGSGDEVEDRIGTWNTDIDMARLEHAQLGTRHTADDNTEHTQLGTRHTADDHTEHTKLRDYA